MSDTDQDYSPILQVSVISTKLKKNAFLESVQKDDDSRHITLHAIDGDGNMITIEIASQMIFHTGHIQAGTVIVLLKFMPIFFDYHKGSYQCVFLVIYIYFYTYSYCFKFL